MPSSEKEELENCLTQDICGGDEQGTAQAATALAQRQVPLSILFQKSCLPPDSIRVHITVEHAASSAHISLQVHPHSRVAALQEKVFKEYSFPPQVQCWVTGHCLCVPERSLASYRVQKDGDPTFVYGFPGTPGPHSTRPPGWGLEASKKSNGEISYLLAQQPRLPQASSPAPTNLFGCLLVGWFYPYCTFINVPGLNATDTMKSKFGEMLLHTFGDLDDEEFKICKFYLKIRDLITGNQVQAGRTDLSDYMIEKFGAFHALNKIVKVLKDMNLNEAARTLQNKKAEVEKDYNKKKEKKPVTRNNKAQMRPASNGNNTGNHQVTKKGNLKHNNESKKNRVAKKRKATTKESPESKKMKVSQEFPQKTEPEGGREDCPQTMPMVVKVLKVSQIFEYDTIEEKKEMFHATVANEHEFIRVKVLNMDVKEHINKNKVIEISNGHWKKGFLEINRCSRVQDVSTSKKITVPKNIQRRAGKTTKIRMLEKQKQGSYVDGVYEIDKKTEKEKCTFFDVKDNTGKIKVVTFGKWAKINCEIGDKLRLTCFELSFWKETQLKSVTHSFIKVIKAKKN